jgi:hypothetical protein
MKSWFWLCVVGLLTSTFAGSAKAATSVAVLGVRAIDGDTELEWRLSQALREAVGSFEDFAVGDRDASLEQMMLAHGCDDPNATCLGDIARTLGVERMFWGTVSAAERGYELTLSQFDTRKSSVETATLRQLGAEQIGSSGAAKATTSKLVQRLTGRITSGYVIVTSVPMGEVHVDGIRRGALDEAGMFTLELPTGDHTVRVTPRGDHPLEERSVRIKPGESTRLSVEGSAEPAAVVPTAEIPVETPRRDRRFVRRVLGWVAVGVGAALAGATVYSWVRLRQIADDEDYKTYRASFPPRGSDNGVGNVCREADRGTLAAMDPAQAKLERSAKSLCQEADALEVAQYVLLGGALVAAGTGTYLLLTSRPRPAGELSLQPRFDGTSARLELSTAF